jgi:hypothetical protein
MIPDADRVLCLEGNTVGRVMRVPQRSGVVRDPGMCGRSLRGNREIVCHERKPEGFAELYGR